MPLRQTSRVSGFTTVNTCSAKRIETELANRKIMNFSCSTDL